ncbi:MAG: SDR family oxidoreductase [Chlamydiia bacterium]|nr:SDR family oxidoreductase [Chlamydiia bacterium]
MDRSNLFAPDTFSGKCAIIAGGGGDFALAIALGFARGGIKKIALLDNDDALEKAATLLKKEGAHAIKVAVDLSNEEALQEAIKSLYLKGGEIWDILVTASGLFIGSLLVDSKLEDLERLMQINALAVLEISKLIAKGMIERRYGKIIHLGSSATYFGTPGSGIYAASKVVVNQLTQTMAVEWGPHNIQVNTVCPTVADTKFLRFVEGNARHAELREKVKERMPLKRLLKVEDVAPIVLFLASDGSQLINGAIIPVDGGSRLLST